MASNSNVHTSVPVNGALLQSDRKAAGYTQEAFCNECDSVTLGTVRRAEQGKRIIRVSLERMAEVLGHGVDRYILSDILDGKKAYTISVEGRWTGFFVEADRATQPYVVEEDATLAQSGARISGEIIAKTPSDVRYESYEATRVLNNVLIGTLVTKGWEPPLGMGNFVLSASRSNDWMEGFTSWLDVDSDRIETSRCILVRAGCPNYEGYLEDARRTMDQEVAMYQLRKLVEAGYSLREAIVMWEGLNAMASSEAG